MTTQAELFFDKLQENPELSRQLLAAQTEDEVQSVIQKTGVETTIEEIESIFSLLNYTVALRLTAKDDDWFEANGIKPEVKRFLEVALGDEGRCRDLLQISSKNDLKELIVEYGFSLQADEVSKAFRLYMLDNNDTPENFELDEEDLGRVTGGGGFCGLWGAGVGAIIGGAAGTVVGGGAGAAVGAAGGAVTSVVTGSDMTKSVVRGAEGGAVVGGADGMAVGATGGAITGALIGLAIPEP